MRDLIPSEGSLSVFLINDDESNLQRVIAAQAARRDRTEKFDYILMDYKELDALGIQWEKTPANTPDDQVNASHIDLLCMNVSKIVDLAYAFRTNSSPVRVGETEIKELLKQGVASGHLVFSKINLKSDQEFRNLLGDIARGIKSS